MPSFTGSSWKKTPTSTQLRFREGPLHMSRNTQKKPSFSDIAMAPVTVVLELEDHVIHNLCAKTELHVCSRACQAAQKKEVFKDLKLSIYKSKELARPKCGPQDTCRTPSSPPKTPDKQEAHP